MLESNSMQAVSIYGHQPEACIHYVFEAQVERTPEAVALVYEDQQLTYRELNRRSNQLAHYLQQLGVGAETLVGICIERSPELVIGLLAILKAGGSYVPLDPHYPVERLALVLQDAHAPLLLTQERLVPHLPEHSAQLLCLDTDWTRISESSAENPVSPATLDHLAYVLYTSGSTGRPKGVMIPHRALSNHMTWMQTAFGLNAAERVVQKTPISFDASVWEFYAPLLNGGQLILAPAAWRADSAVLIRTITEQSATYLQVVPTLLRILLDDPHFRDCVSLRHVFCGGEALPADSVRQFLATLPAKLHNLYGPTECCIDATYWTCDVASSDTTIPIGRPIANTQAYILDDDQQPVPVGVAGELYIGGEGLGRGYVNRPDLTAERFVPNAFTTADGGLPTTGRKQRAEGNGQESESSGLWSAPQPSWGIGGRLYRTGDLAKYRADGNLEFLGRADYQVKLRGFRIELGEIEAVLAKHPAVKQVVVLAREDIPGDKRLVAYLVPRTESPLVLDDLRTFLQAKLPDYMIPATFVALDALPLSPNGKVDRRVLPVPDWSSGEETFVAPRTLLEQAIAQVWVQVFALPRIGVYDSFFEMGGHSLLAGQIASRLSRQLNCELGMREVLEAGNVAALAELIQSTIETESSPSQPSLVRVARETDLPLSFAQQQLWLVDQLQPGNIAYNLPSAFRLSGPLDVAALEQSLNASVERHESLRTTFGLVNGSLVQTILPRLTIQLEQVDLRPLAPDEREVEAQRLLVADARRPFDLQQGPLVCAALFHLDENEQLLLLNLHHIVSDGWSFDLLLAELGTFYTGLISGEAPSLAELPIQYADYAVWQRQWLSPGGDGKYGELVDRQLAYWKRQLLDAPRVLELPTARPRPPVQTFAGARCSVTLSKDLVQAVQALSQSEGATLFMTLLAAFKVLLYRYTGQTDLIVGTPSAGRNRVELEPLIGYFVNMLVLRTNLVGNPTFREVLARVRKTTLSAYANQDVPFEQLVQALQPDRDLSYNPLFQVAFDVVSQPTKLVLPAVRVAPVPFDMETAQFDLFMELQETGDGLVGLIEYNTDLFDASTITRLVEHFQMLLEAIVANPNQPISDLEFLSVAERQRLLVEWNNTRLEYATEQLVPQLFEDQVARAPDAVVVASDAQTLTYGELSRRANQLAHYLQALGISPETVVGICVERSPEMLIGQLAILKAGGAYLPLDSTYPPERLAFMLYDADAPMVLTQQHLLGQLPHTGIHVLCLDTDWDEMALQPTHNLLSEVDPRNPAYVIYTSGSTGQPKGVQIEHRALLNLIRWHQREYQVSPTSRATQLAGLGFDASVWEVWPYLTAGASLHLPGENIRAEAVLLRDWLLEQAITITFLPTPLAEAVLLLDWPDDCLLQLMLTGGDRLHQFAPSDLPFKLINNYGPTENTVVATNAWVESPSAPHDLPPIGRPIANTQAYVLDANLLPVPVGVVGELYLGGESLARGYLHRPDLTAERFVPNPFTTADGRQRPNFVGATADDEGQAIFGGRRSVVGRRVYKTGDLVKYRADGNLEFVGRVDHQVKLRGFRIELGEIEAALQQYPAVQSAVVLVREDAPGDKRLVAYLVPQPGRSFAASDLHSYLQGKLPDYMLPSAFVLLESFPLNASGKVDRRALPAPDWAALESTMVSPRTPLEQAVAEVWTQVLGIERIGIYDNFFRLGGHSLLASQIISQLRQLLGIDLSVRVLFGFPTIAELTEQIEVALREGQQLKLPAIQRAQQNGDALLSFSQLQLWLIEHLMPGSPAYNLPFAFRVRGQLDYAALQQSLNEIIRRHEALRAIFISVDGEPRQRIAPQLEISLPLVELTQGSLSEREADAQQRKLAEARRPFDLARGPLLRAQLFRLDELDYILLLTVHHIVFDGWSTGILLKELELLYAAFCAARPSPLPELTLQYADYANWQRMWLTPEAKEAQLAYWREQLKDAPRVLELPLDRPRPAVQSGRGAHETRNFSLELSGVIQALSQQEGTSLFMTLLAAFQVLLHRYTGQNTIVVGTPSAGRTVPDIEGLIGYFVNMLVLQTDMGGDPSFREVLQRVRETTLGAYAHQDLPFGVLVEELQPERNASYNPLFQVDLVLNTPLAAPVLTGLSVTPLAVDMGVVQADDLSLQIDKTEKSLMATLEYNTDLFDAVTIKRILLDYETLLKSVVANPDQKISALLPSVQPRPRGPQFEPINVNRPPAERTSAVTERRKKLSAEKRALLEKRLRGE